MTNFPYGSIGSLFKGKTKFYVETNIMSNYQENSTTIRSDVMAELLTLK
uniref:Uncharacterized protein n=1 Tax=Rhizophora mucronata TaxID=61149 RepID=A0A2P2N3S3_RHIMU